jgi:hypothetical protein
MLLWQARVQSAVASAVTTVATAAPGQLLSRPQAAAIDSRQYPAHLGLQVLPEKSETSRGASLRSMQQLGRRTEISSLPAGYGGTTRTWPNGLGSSGNELLGATTGGCELVISSHATVQSREKYLKRHDCCCLLTPKFHISLGLLFLKLPQL